jgi:hypothetical protein
MARKEANQAKWQRRAKKNFKLKKLTNSKLLLKQLLTLSMQTLPLK